MALQHQSVTEVITKVKSLLEGQFRQIIVIGEVTNLSSSSTGHWYFTLSDRNSSLSAALFKMDALRNPSIKNLKDGDKVICAGSIGVYSKRGTFQIIVKQISPAGKGDLKEQFEKLKKKLAGEGLFDMEIKKPIPKLPKRVAIITAKKAAALQDFLNIYSRRSNWMDIILVPALVQGEAAPKSIREALFNIIKYSLSAPKEKQIDAIVLTRGGGSLEDLWAFNDEALAWDIYNCPIPIISAVGHQVDFSISDFVADLRCETPSAAAEVLTEEQVSIKERMQYSIRNLTVEMNSLLQEKRHETNQHHPRAILDKIWSRFNNAQRRLNNCRILDQAYHYTGLGEYNMRLDDSVSRMQTLIQEKLVDRSNRVEKSGSLLQALGPQNVLERGYTYVQKEDGSLVASNKDFKKIKTNDELNIIFKDGIGKVSKFENK